MIDVRRLRTDLERTIAALARKRVPEDEVRRAAALDSEHRQLAARSEELRSRVKALSKQVGDAMRSGDAANAEAAREESKRAGEELAALERQGAVVEAQLRDAMLRLPNLPSEDAPDGASEKDNVVVRTVGYDPARYGPHQRAPHWEIGAELQILDLERGAKIAGSMFPLFQGQGATLVRALCQLALDRNADAFTEVRPPTLVRTPVMEAVGQLPKFADDAYHLERDDLWAIPTAEVPLTSMRANEILADEELPLRLMAYTPCYRREAGAAGRDTRGLLRVHEFDKVEILAICRRDQAAALHAELLDRAVGSVAALGLPYRILDISTGDLGSPTPASSTSRFMRRAATCGWRCRRSRGSATTRPGGPASVTGPPAVAPVQICDTLNGSALAVPRIWAALVETYRQSDGTVELPACLHPYFRGSTSITGSLRS